MPVWSLYVGKEIGIQDYHSVGSPANLDSRPSMLALGRADASIALLSLLANFKQPKNDCLFKSNGGKPRDHFIIL